jgi:rSAM/selenodomain-associated transferase 2
MISIITPVLDEEEWIGSFITTLSALEGSFECILVDGGSCDGTRQEALRMREQVSFPLTLLSAPRGRARQMNAGAEVASGDILLFLHVDCRIPADSTIVIEDAIRNGGASGGGFLHSFAPSDPLLYLTSTLGNLHARVTSVFFGDFGFFVRRDLFEAVGGFDTSVPFCEDAEFCRTARRHGRLVTIPRTILSSSRRYAWTGRWRLTAIFAAVIALDTLGIRPRRLAPFVVGRKDVTEKGTGADEVNRVGKGIRVEEREEVNDVFRREEG